MRNIDWGDLLGSIGAILGMLFIIWLTSASEIADSLLR